MQPMRALIAIDDQASFRNDVQLDLFDEPEENLALLRSFIFTVAAPGNTRVSDARQVSSVDLLNQLIEAYNNNRAENRFVAIANYGHGKSHLALALANYFSKPFSSPESELVIEKLNHALNDPARASRFYDFKQGRGEFLVVRLRGDTPSSLREQFLPSLEKALQEHNATANIKPPIWHEYAAELLSTLTPDELSRANHHLAEYRLDVPNLLAQVRDRRDVWDYCVGALTAAKNMAPNLGAQLSMRATLEWVADELCGEGKPLAGVLVMFDEFSLYVSRYAQRGAVGELQDLLNGVSSRVGKIVFLAFAQHDPMTVANNAAASEHARDTLKHELTRIPKKMSLYTLMESVLDAYLRQRDYAWSELNAEMHIRGAVLRATGIAYESFQKRYTEDLHWTPDEFERVVTKGTFPLHPLTTALLCNLRFVDASGMSDPRTVLGFVMEHLSQKLDETTVVNDRVNWVYPVALVDYFGANVSHESHTAFQSAMRNLPFNANEVQRSLLKALLLQDAAKLNLPKDKQGEFLCEASGLPYAETQRALNALSDANVIRYDSIKKIYSFWPVNTDPGKLERLLRSKLEKISFDLVALNKFNNEQVRSLRYAAIPMHVEWGHAEDWAANQLVLTREHFNAGTITQLTRPFSVSTRSIDESDRGCVIWLLARNEEDITWYRKEADMIVEQAITGDNAPPLLVVLPKEPTPDLLEAYRRHLALTALSSTERTDVGTMVFDHELQQSNKTITAELIRLIGELNNYLDLPRDPSYFVVPVAFRSAMVATRSASVKATLLELYKQAYRNAPRRFFTQYRASTQGSNRLRSAIRQVAGILFTGQTEGMANAIATDPVARDLCEKYLVQEWGLLTGDYVLQKPTDLRLHQAWNVLEKQFSPGVKDKKLAPPLVQLINPPNGYDYNTVTLLFAAWFGYHAHDCTLTRSGRETRIDIFVKFLEKGPKDLLLNLRAENAALSRRNPNETRLEVQDLVRRVRTAGAQFSIEEAEKAREKLVAFSQDSRNNTRECEDAQSAAETLNGAIEKAKTYEQQVGIITETISAENNLSKLIETLKIIRNLPRLSIVVTDSAQPTELSDSLLQRIESVVEQACQGLEKPTVVTDVGLYRRQLQGLQVTLERTGLSQFIQRVTLAIQSLEANATALKAQESEEGIRRMLSDVNVTLPLAQLIEKRVWLSGLVGYSDELLQQRDRKLRDVDDVIKQLEIQVAGLPTSIEAAVSQRKVDELRDQWNRNLMRYEGSIHYKLIDEAIDRLNKLGEFFQHLAQLPRQVKHPKDLASLQQQVASLRKLYEEYMSPVHLSLLADVEQGHQSYVATQQNAAIRWLQECTSEVNTLVGTSGSRVNGLVDKLDNPPVFLPESNLAKVEQLKQQVQEKLDSDTMLQVEAAFRKIKDYQRQQECLRRLYNIVNAETAKSALG